MVIYSTLVYTNEISLVFTDHLLLIVHRVVLNVVSWEESSALNRFNSLLATLTLLTLLIMATGIEWFILIYENLLWMIKRYLKSI